MGFDGVRLCRRFLNIGVTAHLGQKISVVDLLGQLIALIATSAIERLESSVASRTADRSI